MGQSDDIDDSTYSRHQELCQKLNMDATSASEAWRSYETIRQNYSLEGEAIHWIGCALYVACRKTPTSSSGRSSSNVETNRVSLTRLLRLCNLPLLEFFSKSKQWADMANMPQDFRFRIEKLERNFAVSFNIFKKYQPIFADIFQNPAETLQPTRSRRQKNIPCTPGRVFEFCWSLFVCIKGTIPAISDDLVNSYHLLLVCCDLMYKNAILNDRRDLLNPNFPGLPSNFNEESYIPSKTANCILELLSNRHDAITVEAMIIKEHIFKNLLNKLFDDQVLQGERSNFSEILETTNFDANFKAVNKLYEHHVLSVGDFDERIFLGESANVNIGSPRRIINVGDLQEQFQARRESEGGVQNSAPPTPLTGRKYLRPRDTSSVAPVSNATQSVNRLFHLLNRRQGSPSEALLEIFNSCSRDVKTIVETKVKEIGDLFCAKYTQNTNGTDNSSLDFGKKRVNLAQPLFYKILEMILKDEKSKKPNVDITNLITNEVFVQCLFACCLEIVIYSYKNEDRTFPWILSALNIEAYYFYKVIEITVKVEEQLSRDVVKHLNCIEEKILESLAWKKNSPLWLAIESTEGGVPSCEDVSLPGFADSIEQNIPGHPGLRRIALDRGTHYDIQSPISSASERFQSPISSTGVPKKQLFGDSKSSGHSLLRVGGQSVLTSKVFYVLPEQTSTPKSTASNSSSQSREATRSKRTGSVALFFRKFYNLAAVRMHDLCHNLSIDDEDLKKKIWTIFEYSIKEATCLMRDRHLDQILMCAVYVICKLAKIEKNSFTEIMRCYRLQPQAESHIYRSVLIQNENENDVSGDSENGLNAQVNNVAPPTPSNMAGTSQNFGSEIRGDLIKFYNTVYVPPVKEFANRLGIGRANPTNLTLSPLPRGKSTKKSPIKRITGCVTTRIMDSKAISATPAPTLSYCLGRSPAKDLEAINKMVISVDAKKSVGKRLLSNEGEVEMSQESNKKYMTTAFVARKLENILDDRRIQNQ
ncbi:retinoblastoma-like protein 1 isoform X2 [Leptopilina heterotoma]|uniref:retinoblastoma-like protein 1 isoform X2 n=1 Tax=Leptopilina heterotoma TaxID=63436 RepID=UPI001CA8CAF4|nr:retinoblastoma-like protein 1 isoform X2 [Leptopilina heterotoma]